MKNHMRHKLRALNFAVVTPKPEVLAWLRSRAEAAIYLANNEKATS